MVVDEMYVERVHHIADVTRIGLLLVTNSLRTFHTAHHKPSGHDEYIQASSKLISSSTQ
jgi:hypothetical protein